MKKFLLSSLLIAVLAVLTLTTSAAAQNGQPPVGTCLPGFERHMVMEPMGDHDHHIGLTVDLNQNGYWCVKHLDNGLHVHVDDVIRQ